MAKYIDDLLQFEPGMRVATWGESQERGAWDRIVIDKFPADLAGALHEAKSMLRHEGRVVLVQGEENKSFHDALQILEKNAWSVHRHGHFPHGGYFLEASPTDESVQS